MTNSSQKSKTISLIDGIVTLFKYTLILWIVWFFIGAGVSGWYEIYCRKIKKEKPNELTSEMIGKLGFILYCVSVVIIFLMLVNGKEEFGAIILLEFLKWSILFFLFCFVGLIYFFRHLKS